MEAPHPTADLGEELLSLVRLDAKLATGHDLLHGPFDLNQVFTTHACSSFGAPQNAALFRHAAAPIAEIYPMLALYQAA
jgi:hypothetical protein